MLYDPRWEQKTRADPFSLASLIAWLEQQPANGGYCYVESGRCLIAQYLMFLGHTTVSVGAMGYFNTATMNGQAPPTFHNVAIREPWTYGAALKRARKAAQTKGL